MIAFESLMDLLGNFWQSVHPIWAAITATLFLFYKKAISDLEVSTGYIVAGSVALGHGATVPTLMVRARKVRYSWFIVPNPIFVEILGPKDGKKEIDEKEHDFMHKGFDSDQVVERVHIDYEVGEPLFFLKVTSQEGQTPRVVASALNYVATANVKVEFSEPRTHRRISYIEFRLNKPGVWDSEVLPGTHFDINFRVEWNGKPRAIGRILTWVLHSTFINYPSKTYRLVFEKLRRVFFPAKSLNRP